MKTKTILLAIFGMIIMNSCSQPETQKDAIVGKWYLKQFYRNDSLKILDECGLMRSIEFKEDYYYTESYFKKDSLNICRANGTSGYKWSTYNGNYTIDNGSVFKQDHKIWINNNNLYYTFEGWHFVGSSIQTSNIKLIFTK